MIIPVGEGTKRHSFPIFNLLLIAANVAVYSWQTTRPDFGFKDYALVPAAWNAQSLLTSIYLHGSIWHLLGNLLFLFIAGASVEDRMGHVTYLVYYHLAGVAAAAAHVLTTDGSAALLPCVGASGAISGVMGAYLVFFPTAPITFLVLPFFKTIKSPCWYAVLLWAGMQWLLWVEVRDGKSTGVAVAAHLGGFAFGVAAGLLLRIFGKPPGEKDKK